MEYSSLFSFIFLYIGYSIAIINILINLKSIKKASMYKYNINMFLGRFMHINND
jgi:formiminotetrahydrofolate cyclodeaminase